MQQNAAHRFEEAEVTEMEMGELTEMVDFTINTACSEKYYVADKRIAFFDC